LFHPIQEICMSIVVKRNVNEKKSEGSGNGRWWTGNHGLDSAKGVFGGFMWGEIRARFK
jgi:hypothetical protein